MSSGLDLDDFDALPAANQEARSRSATPVLNIRSKPTKKKHVPRYLGDDDDDDLTNLDALFNDLDDVPDVLPPPPKLKRSRADGPADDNTWQGGEIGAADEEGDGGKQKKARLPRAKMDETRLLGPNGFPKLKEQAKKFKVGKKGNEREDLKRLMAMYQLWAHQMFPAMNFTDTVTRVETLCRKRSVASALTTWRREAEGRLPEPLSLAALREGSQSPPPEPRQPSTGLDEDLYAAIASTQRDPLLLPTTQAPIVQNNLGFDDQDLDLDNNADDEEAMLELEMQDAANNGQQPVLAPRPTIKDAPLSNSKPPDIQASGNATAADEFDDLDFGDEEDILRELDQAASTKSSLAVAPPQQHHEEEVPEGFEDEYQDDEDVMRELAMSN